MHMLSPRIAVSRVVLAFLLVCASLVAANASAADIDYMPSTHLLYVGAAKAGLLTVARVDGKGTLAIVAKVPTHTGARNPAVTNDGTVYLAHSGLGKLSDLVVASPKK